MENKTEKPFKGECYKLIEGDLCDIYTQKVVEDGVELPAIHLTWSTQHKNGWDSPAINYAIHAWGGDDFVLERVYSLEEYELYKEHALRLICVEKITSELLHELNFV